MLIMNKILSIITVCYNSEKKISKCLDSILPQLNRDVEYIIVDGKSKDSTNEIIKDKIKNSRFVKYISEKDDGIYDAMNKGINLSNGKYILFINSDDELTKNIVNDIIPTLKKSENDVIYGNVYYQMEKNGKKYVMLKKFNNNPDDMKKYMIVHHQGTFTKRKALIETGCFDTNYKIYGDYDSFLKIYNNGGKFEYIDKAISFFSVDGVSSLKPSIKERLIVRKKNNAYPILILRDIKNCILVKIKIIAKKIGFDVDKYRIKKGLYKEYKE